MIKKSLGSESDVPNENEVLVQVLVLSIVCWVLHLFTFTTPSVSAREKTVLAGVAQSE